MRNKRNKQPERIIGVMLMDAVLLLILLVWLFWDGKTMPYWPRAVLFGAAVLLVFGSVVISWKEKRIAENRLQETILKLESARLQADTTTREVIENITHDLKTPLTAIKGYSQGILDGIAATPERMNKYVTTIRNKANDMAGLVDELTYFALLYQDDIQYTMQEVDAETYLSRCVSDLSLDLELKKISLVYQFLPEERVRILVDLEKMKRVINNIIGNASKYIDHETGVVSVRTYEQGDCVIIQITDNGVGIEKENLPYIFERFYRTDSSRNSKTGGSGLGLAIARKIIEDHNGKIWADSERGKGTRISISLPKVVDAEGKM